MDYFEDRHRLYELTVVSEGHSDDYAIECFDMSPDGAGLVGVLRVAPDGTGLLTLHTELSVQLLRRWLAVAEAEAGLASSNE